MSKPKVNVKAELQRMQNNFDKQAHAGKNPSPTKKGPGRFHDEGRRIEKLRIARSRAGV